MTDLLVKNAKIAKANSDTHTVYNFGIPAYRSASGLATCPLAGTCATGCYAQAGAYRWAAVAAAYEWRLQQTLSDQFIELMTAALVPKQRTAKRQGKQLVIRIHDSGDFYNAEYVTKWLTVIDLFPDVLFYAYTKMVPLFRELRKQGRIPANFVLIFSEGGKADRLIDTATDRHSRVFGSEAELASAGYANAMTNDLVACLGSNHRIGLVFHGAASRKWVTSAA